MLAGRLWECASQRRRMSKYQKLWEYLGQCADGELLLSFEEIGNIAGVPIDHSFLRCKQELPQYGWRVEKLSLKQQTVRFCRIGAGLVVYVHGKGGSPAEAKHYRSLFPGWDVVGLNYRAATPWEAKTEFAAAFEKLAAGYCRVILIANSIGAYLSMGALPQKRLERAFFISPIVDMERLICDMMGWASVSEEELREKGTIETAFGETLSWQYLCYVRENPIRWAVPTEILYGGRDNLTARQTVSAFAAAHGAGLTVLEPGEHWFHTPEQMAFLDRWLNEKLAEEGEPA